MTLLVRKISIAKWDVEFHEKRGSINSDALTSCLRSSGNTLSFWEIEDASQLDTAVLCLALMNDQLATFDLVALAQDDLAQAGLRFETTLGETKYQNGVHLHRDAVNLSADDVLALSELVFSKVNSDEAPRYTIAKLRALLAQALRADELSWGDLAPRIQRSMQVYHAEELQKRRPAPFDLPE